MTKMKVKTQLLPNFTKDKNEPSRFLGDGVSFRAKLIGVLEVPEARGDRMCQEALADLKMAIRAAGEHKQRIQVHVAIDGLRLRDDKTADCLYHHPVHKISFIAQDMTDSRAFGYIFGSPTTGHRFFGIKTDKAASQVVIAMRDLFQVVFELKKKEFELAKQHLGVEASLDGKLPPKRSHLDDKAKITTSEASSSNVAVGAVSAAGGKVGAGAGEGVAELVDLEQELTSLRRGLSQVEGLAPPAAAPSAHHAADPFGDSFTAPPAAQKGLLPPPPGAKGRSTPGGTPKGAASPAPPAKPPAAFELQETVATAVDASEATATQSNSTKLSFDVFTELDPLGTGRSKPYVDKKHFFQELKNPPKKQLKDLAPPNSNSSNLLGDILPSYPSEKIERFSTNITAIGQTTGGSVSYLSQPQQYTSSIYSSDPFAEHDPFDDSDPFDKFNDDPFNSAQEFSAPVTMEEFRSRMKESTLDQSEIDRPPSYNKTVLDRYPSFKSDVERPYVKDIDRYAKAEIDRPPAYSKSEGDRSMYGKSEMDRPPAYGECGRNIYNGPLQVSLPPEAVNKSPRLGRQAWSREGGSVRRARAEVGGEPPPRPPKMATAPALSPPLPRPHRKREPVLDRSTKPHIVETHNSSEDEYLTPAPPPVRGGRRANYDKIQRDTTINQDTTLNPDTTLNRNTTVNPRDTTLYQRDATLNQRIATLSQRDSTLSQRDVTLSQRDSTLSQRDVTLSQRDSTLSQRDVTLSQRDSTSQRDMYSRLDSALSRPNLSSQPDATLGRRELTPCRDTFNQRSMSVSPRDLTGQRDVTLSQRDTFAQKSVTLNQQEPTLNQRDRTFGQGDTTFGHRDTFGQRDRTFGQGDRTFGQGDTTFVQGDTTFDKLDTFAKQDATFGQRDATFGQRDTRGQGTLGQLDMTLSQLLTCGPEELARRLHVPAQDLANMTLAALTGFLRNYLQTNESKPAQEPATNIEKERRAERSSLGSAEFKANFEDNFATHETNGAFVANFEDFETKVNPCYDRYAVFREIQELEMKGKSLLDPEPESKEDSDKEEELKNIEDAKDKNQTENVSQNKSPMSALDELTIDSFSFFGNSVSPKPVDSKIEDIKSVMRKLNQDTKSPVPNDALDQNDSKDRYAALRAITITEPDEFESLPPDIPKERKRSDEKSDFENSDFFDCIDNSSLSFSHVDDAFRKSPHVDDAFRMTSQLEEFRKSPRDDTYSKSPLSDEFKSPNLSDFRILTPLPKSPQPEFKNDDVFAKTVEDPFKKSLDVREEEVKTEERKKKERADSIKREKVSPITPPSHRVSAGSYSDVVSGSSPDTGHKEKGRVRVAEGGASGVAGASWAVLGAAGSASSDSEPAPRRSHNHKRASRHTSSSSRDISPWDEEPPLMQRSRHRSSTSAHHRHSRHNSSGSREFLDSGSGREKDKLRDKRDRERYPESARDRRDSGSAREKDRKDSGSGRDRVDVSKERDERHERHRDRRDRKSRDRESWDRDRDLWEKDDVWDRDKERYWERERDYRDGRSRDRTSRDSDRDKHRRSHHSWDDDDDGSSGAGSGRSSPQHGRCRDRTTRYRDDRNYGSLGWRESRRQQRERAEDAERRYGATLGRGSRKSSGKGTRDHESRRRRRDMRDSSRDSREHRDSVREGRDPRNSIREGRDSRESLREGRDSRDSLREGRGSRDSVREGRDSRDSVREGRDSRDSFREGRDSRGSRDSRDSVREPKDTKEPERELRDLREPRDSKDLRDRDSMRERSGRDQVGKERESREKDKDKRDNRFSTDFSGQIQDTFDSTAPSGQNKKQLYSSLEGTKFDFNEDTTASPTDSPATRYRFDSDSVSPRSLFEDDFSPAPIRTPAASIAEEDETADEPRELRPTTKTTHDNIKKSESINIFVRDTDPFENDDFFACTGSDKAAKRENWPSDFKAFDDA